MNTKKQTNITQEDVNSVADAMLADGVSPTRQMVRDALNRGSLTTINKMMRVWELEQEQKAYAVSLDKIDKATTVELVSLINKQVEVLSKAEAERQNAQIASLTVANDELAKNSEKVEEANNSLVERLNEALATIKTLTATTEENATVIADLRRRLYTEERKNEKLENELHEEQTVASALKIEKSELQKRFDHTAKLLTEKAKECNEANDRNERLDKKVAELNEKLEKSASKLKQAQKEAVIQIEKVSVLEVENRNATREIGLLTSSLSEVKTSSEKAGKLYQERLSDKEAEIERLRLEIHNANKRSTELQELNKTLMLKVASPDK